MSTDTPAPAEQPSKSKPKILYLDPRHRYGSSRSNDALKARWLGKEHKNMPKMHFVVWFGMMQFVGKWNRLDVRYREIAEFIGISLGSVQRAMAYFEQHDFVVRTSEPEKDAVWMINPRLQWNWTAESQAGGLKDYAKHRRQVLKRQADKAEQPAISTASEPETTEYLADSDIIDGEFDDNWVRYDPDLEDEQLCASR
jgi:hypothetical protein